MMTTSVWKRTKEKVLHPAAQVGMALLTTAAMIFAPEIALPALMVNSVVGTIQTVDEVVERSHNGTLTTARVGIAIASIGLNLITPAAREFLDRCPNPRLEKPLETLEIRNLRSLISDRVR